MRHRSLVTGIALLLTGTAIGVATQHLASAELSSGERPVLVPIEPCRLTDTRPDDQIGPRSAPLGTGDTHTVDAQEPDVPCDGRIPSDASALSLNVTALNATTLTFLTIWAGGDRPLAASLNPAPGEPPTPNAVTVDLSDDLTFNVYNDVGSVDVVIDVNGYYVDHTHDDRYVTQPEPGEWEVHLGPTDLVSPQATPPLLTFWDGKTGAVGMGFQAGQNGLVYLSWKMPPEYRTGEDVALDIRWMMSRNTPPVSGCSVELIASSANVSRPGAPEAVHLTEWADGAGTTPVPEAAEDAIIATKTLVVDADSGSPAGMTIEPGDRVIASLGRDGSSMADTCDERFVVKEITVRPA